MKAKIKLTRNEFFIEIPDELLSELGWKINEELQIEITDICEDDGEYKGIIISKTNNNG